MLISALVLALAAAPARPGAAAQLCEMASQTSYTCRLGAKTLAVCGKGVGATYRFGSRGRVDVEAGSPTFVFKGDSGGGEAQMAFYRGAYSYVVYDWTFRTNFGASGHHDQAFIQGVLVRRDGRTLADLHCTQDPPDAASDLYHTGETAPAGEHVDHSP